MSETKFVRSESEYVLAGICGGVANYLGIAPTLVRFAFLILIITSGLGLFLYMSLWLILPSENYPNGMSTRQRLQSNIAHISQTISNNFIRRDNQVSIGIALLCLGIYFFLKQLNWLSNINILWLFAIICIGVFIFRRYRNL